VGAIRRLLKRVRERVPDTPLRYLSALLALILITALTWLLVHFHAPRNPALGAAVGFVFIAVILGSAWLGYGPGLMVCVLTSFVVRGLIATPTRNPPINYTQFATLVAISLLVSRVSQVSRRHEAHLRRAAVDLEQRVRERTAEAINAANEVREQAQLLELAHDAILSMDWNGTIRFWNRGAEQMYGWTKEESLGKI